MYSVCESAYKKMHDISVLDCDPGGGPASHGSAVKSAHIFLVGGQSGSGPTATVESTIW